MIAIILAGGFGTRLEPLTNSCPKSLLPLLNRPMINYILDSLPKEVDDVIIAASYKIEVIKEFFESREYPFKITVSEEKEPLGTGGGIKNCEKLVDSETEILVFNGDVISSLDVQDFINHFRSTDGIGSISLWPVSNPSKYGMVELDENNRILSFKEKPDKKTLSKGKKSKFLINAGTYLFNHKIFEHIPAGKKVSIEHEVFPKIIDSGLYGFPFSGYWIDAGTAVDFINAHKILIDTHLIYSEEQLNEMTGKLVQKFPEVVIEPPVYTGEGVLLGKGSIIGPYAFLEDGVVVGSDCQINNSVIMNDSVIDSGTVIEKSIIAPSNTIGKNCKLKKYFVTAEGETVADDEVKQKNSKSEIRIPKQNPNIK